MLPENFQPYSIQLQGYHMVEIYCNGYMCGSLSIHGLDAAFTLNTFKSWYCSYTFVLMWETMARNSFILVG